VRGPGLAHAYYWLDSGRALLQAVQLKSPGRAGNADRGRPRSTFSHRKESLDPAGRYDVLPATGDFRLGKPLEAAFTSWWEAKRPAKRVDDADGYPA
jgi:hypothetical protein